jgi:hypothetical protein
MGGFDNHASQVVATDTTTGTHANLLKNLSDAIAAFQLDLTQLKVDDRVVGMTFSEFGRRAISNGSYGTDHGTSAPMFVFGSGVKTTMVGKNPNLSDLDSTNNLKMQTDFRQVYAAVLKDWFGTSNSAETTTIFRDFTAAPIFQNLLTATEPVASTAVSLYPNPASGDVVLQADSLPQALSTVQMTDMQGRLLILSASATPGALRFNVGNLPEGQYIVHVGTLHGVVNERLVVAR